MRVIEGLLCTVFAHAPTHPPLAPFRVFKFVPAILHALIAAIELHGSSSMGLYRVSGRLRSVQQFVCAANLVSQVLFVLRMCPLRHIPVEMNSS